LILLFACTPVKQSMDDATTDDGTVASTLQVSAVNPAAVFVAPLRQVVISGQGFDADTRVKFGDTWSPHVELRDAFTIAADTPPKMAPGSYDVSVLSPYEKAVLAGAITFNTFSERVPLADFEGPAAGASTAPAALPLAPPASAIVLNFSNSVNSGRDPALDPKSSIELDGGSHVLRFAGPLIPISASELEVFGGWDMLLAADHKSFFDMTHFVGVRFRARELSGAATITIRFSDVNTAAEGGVCTECSGDYHFEVPVSADWKTYDLRFDAVDDVGRLSFARYTWGDPKKAFAQRQVHHITFEMDSKIGARPVDLWLDDVALIRADLIDRCEDNDDFSEANPNTDDATGGTWFRFAAAGSTETNGAPFRPTTATRPFAMTGAPFAWGVQGSGALGSNYYAHFNAKLSGFGGLGVRLRPDDDAGNPRALDASGYLGVSFWARANGTAQRLTLQIPSATTDAAAALCANCGDHFAAAVIVGSQWQRYYVPFSGLAQAGSGDPTLFDASAVYRLLFGMDQTATVDFAIDEIRFVLPGETP
jgi:hypothetical protein